ncbi:MAG: hypothetical protein AB7V00_02445 [Bacilli bacterium]
MDYKEAAKNFLNNEKQFHLGVIPTEQSNPETRNLSATIMKDTAAGIKMILDVDKKIPDVAAKAFATKEFEQLVNDIKRVIDEKKTILFSSVGASGRMALQLDGMWRHFWTSLITKIPAKRHLFMENIERCQSFMTGGDRALVKTAENYEDYMTFGREQIKEAHVGPGDVVVGLAECGLSASINGSVLEADDRGCTTYYVYCNPKDILIKYLDRVRVVFERKNIIEISLYVGNMAVAGSTRMQITTVELLAMGAALEVAFWRWLKENLTEEELSIFGQGAYELEEYPKMFADLLDNLTEGAPLKGLADAVDFEKNTYTNNGLITYITHEYLIDIMTDTTERQPTFTLPPFRQFLDHKSQVSWAYVKDPLYPNSVAWSHIIRRPIKGLDWSKEDYIRMGASLDIINNPPLLASNEIEKFNIGNVDDPSRYSRKPANLVAIDINGSAYGDVMKWFNQNVGKYGGGTVLRIGDIPDVKLYDHEMHVPLQLPRTLLDLMTHLLVKLSFNLFSTATMAKMGRIWSNWMIQVFPSNKKLIDRSTRIIATLAKIPYEQACEEFFKSYLGRKPGEEYRESYVVETLRRLGFDPKADIE